MNGRRPCRRVYTVYNKEFYIIISPETIYTIFIIILYVRVACVICISVYTIHVIHTLDIYDLNARVSKSVSNLSTLIITSVIFDVKKAVICIMYIQNSIYYIYIYSQYRLEVFVRNLEAHTWIQKYIVKVAYPSYNIYILRLQRVEKSNIIYYIISR